MPHAQFEAGDTMGSREQLINGNGVLDALEVGLITKASLS